MQTADNPLPLGGPLWSQRAVIARHGLQVVCLCLGIGLVLGWLRGSNPWPSVVYALAIGLVSWASIDFGRFALNPEPLSGWPAGWRGPALMVAGCTLGFVAGTALGDAWFGHNSWSLFDRQPRAFAASVVISALIGGTITSFYYFRGRHARQQTRLAQAERDATLARLTLLQSQLEPHMLFNTLANLRVLIGREPAQALAMLDRLIAFLRATLSASRVEWHPLATEFERLQDYLALMSVRMGTRLRVRLTLPPELAQWPVPPLLLQPLVENCIKHGLEPKVEGGRVEVTARRDGAQLELLVRDTGLGLTSTDMPDTGFGLSQIRERLATLYGEHASLVLRQADDPEGGTWARILLPTPAAQPSA